MKRQIGKRIESPRLNKPEPECCEDTCDGDSPIDKPRPVEAKLRALTESIESLGKIVSFLGQRLGNVLRDSPEEHCREEGCPMPLCSPITEQLIILESRVRLTENLISDMIDRLEV